MLAWIENKVKLKSVLGSIIVLLHYIDITAKLLIQTESAIYVSLMRSFLPETLPSEFTSSSCNWW